MSLQDLRGPQRASPGLALGPTLPHPEQRLNDPQSSAFSRSASPSATAASPQSRDSPMPMTMAPESAAGTVPHLPGKPERRRRGDVTTQE